MQAVKTVTLTTADGVERELRCTPGALKRIADEFGSSDFGKLAAERGDWVIFYVAYYMMYDADGNPPDLTLGRFLEETPSDATEEVLAAVLSAASQGRKEKNELATLIHQATQSQTGLSSLPLDLSVSDSPSVNSGGVSPSPSSTPESTGGSESESSPIIAAV
ncbi:MAG: hypothetical protein ACXAEN_22365 [Candidatus Thorarchaeota archaeon]|jgi:hypothetical protein